MARTKRKWLGSGPSISPIKGAAVDKGPAVGPTRHLTILDDLGWLAGSVDKGPAVRPLETQQSSRIWAGWLARVLQWIRAQLRALLES